MKCPSIQGGTVKFGNAGFTLVELMVAMVLGLLLTLAVSSMFIANQQSYRRNNLIAQMQNNARFAIRALAHDLTMAGFFGGVSDPGRIEILKTAMPHLPLGGDHGACGPGVDGESGWALDTTALAFVNEANGSSISTTYGCLNANDLVAGSDVVAMHYASDSAGMLDKSGSSPSLKANVFYLRSNRTAARLFYSGQPADDASGAEPPLWYYRYTSHLYFVSPWSECDKNGGERVPTLCRVHIDQGDTTPDVAIEPVAAGVERLEIAFGIDTDGDGIADRYRGDPSQGQLANAVTARITLLMRSIKPDYSYNNEQTYDLVLYDTNTGYTPDDHYYRRVIRTTVVLRNAASGL